MLGRMIAHGFGRVARGSWLVVVLLVLAGCAAVPPATDPPEARRSSQSPAPPLAGRSTVADRAAGIALDQVGVPYRYGGQSPTSGFDCSGLVHYAYREAGKSIPRTTQTLWAGTRRVHRENLRTGDLVFFTIEGKMQHVGLYLGDGRFVHAPSSGRTVSVESLSSPYYQEALLGGGRPP